MKNLAIALLAIFASSGALAWNIHLARNPIPDQYIVVLEEDQFAPPGLATAEQRSRSVRRTADEIASGYRGRRQHVFSESLTGFSVIMRRGAARRLARDPRVAFIAEDAVVESTESIFQPNPPSWGLDRVDQRSETLDFSYAWYAPEPAVDVHVYVLDSGIRSTHTDFGGRVDTLNSFNAYNDGNDVNDCNGHGTHVAGIVGGQQHGVAKNAILHPVRVLSCSGSGSLSAVIAGIDWITTQVIQHQHPAVANMSLATSPSLVLDNAVRTSIEAGVTYVVAAGNNGNSACYYSPARVEEVLTVGATTVNDARAPDSNYGDCVDIYAPGSGISSTFNRSDSDTLTMSGTSMAAPHVAGTAALLLAQNPDTAPAELAEVIIGQASSFVDELGTDGISPLLYSLIEVESGPANGGLEFTYECSHRSRRCVFNASLPPESGTVERYYWDFGDGSSSDHHRPIARHGYRHQSGSVTVILAVELADGGSYMTSQVVDLPF